MVGQRVLLYKDDVRPTPADRLLERRGRNIGGSAGASVQGRCTSNTRRPPFGEEGEKKGPKQGLFANIRSELCKQKITISQTPSKQKKTKNHNFPDPPNHQPIPPHKPNLMKSKMYQKIVISVFLLRIHWDNSRVFLN